MYLTTRPKKARICATCQFWDGCSVQVKDRFSIKLDIGEKAMCKRIGCTRPATRSACDEYEIRYDF